MITLVTGGSGSGKSGMAERLLAESTCKEKYYLATMQAGDDEESKKKIERHRRLRRGKGFRTIEQSLDIRRAAAKMGPESPMERGVLLECLSTLTANEMFRGETPGTSEDVGASEEAGTAGKLKAEATAEKIFEDVEHLYKTVRDLIIVSDNVFEDGMQYDEGTQAYLRALAKLVRELAGRADRVVEVVAGIPVWVKRENSRA